MRNAFADIEHGVDLGIPILRHDLERSEQLGRQELSLPLAAEVLEGHEDGRGLPSAVTRWNGVALERSTSKENLSAIQLKNSINVRLDCFVGPSEDWPDRQVLQASLLRLLPHLLQQASLPPVAVHEHDRLGGAFLASVSIGILIAGVGDHVDILLALRNVRAENLPVVTSILKADLAFERLY